MGHKIGLALGGGGARGSFQIGVVKSLMDLGVMKDIKVVSGTSIGALNTLMIMNELSYERMLEIWNMVDNSHIYGSGADRFKLDRQGIFSIQEVYELFKKQISISEIRNSRIQGYATSSKVRKESLFEQVMLNRMEKKVFHLNEMDDPTRGALASASIPIFFGTTDVKDDYYIDGGVKDNCPIQPLIDQGCDIIIAVPINGGLHPNRYRDSNILLISVEAHYLFHPLLIDVVDFNPKGIPMRVEYGSMLTNYIFKKLEEQGIYTKNTSAWHKPNGYKYIRISRNEEKVLKNDFNK